MKPGDIRLLDDFLPESDLLYLRARGLEGRDGGPPWFHVERGKCAPAPEIGDLGGAYDYLILDRNSLDDLLGPTYIGNLYESVRVHATMATGVQLLESPFHRSSVSMKRFAAGGLQGWHYDTNSMTALLYLTSCGGGETRFTAPEKQIEPVAGRLAVFDGENWLHEAERVRSGIKLTMSFNLYRADREPRRPKGIDELVYGAPVVQEA